MRPDAAAAWSAARPGPAGGGIHPVDAACVAPWVSLEFDPQGWVYTCCANQTYPLGRIPDDRLADLWAGPRARALREALGRWDLSAGCMSCRWHLEHGRVDTDAAVYDRYRLTSPEPAGPASMTFALSNRCNLACVMCNGELSSTIRRRSGRPPLPARYDDRFFEDLAPFLPGLQYAKFLGGEPFLVPDHERVWTLMAEVGGPPRLQVTTNGTVWTDRVEWLLHTFDVDVTVSIDAHRPEAYAAIRDGADHQVMLANVRRFHERCREVGTELRFCFCLMSRNTAELAPFLRWADDLDVPVSINLVTDEGLALRDLDLDALLAVERGWVAEEAAHPSPTAGRNAEVWRTQRAQLAAVIDERRSGAPPPPRLAAEAPRAALAADALPPLDPDRPGPDVDLEVAVLERWAGGGDVALLRVGNDGAVEAVERPNHRLGIGGGLAGRPLASLVDVIAAADGRTAWLIDHAPDGPVLVRTLVLAADAPQRGMAGSVVRTVGWRTTEGSVLLVAEDRMHERSAGEAGPAAVSVAGPRRR